MPAMSSRFKYIEDPGHFALIRLPNGKVPADAIVHGSMSCVMQSVLDSKARNEALDLLARADAAAEQEREREQREQQVITEGIRAIADGIAKLSRRLDAIERSRDARRQLDAISEATEQLLALPKDVPADDTPSPTGELHALPPKDGEQYQPAADMGGVPLSYRAVPTSFVHSGDQGELPPELERRTPPSGTEPVLDPAELAHPPPPTQQPIAIEE
jgi:hypothetical protein